ncbi:hypothetical protein [uncultured Anaerococcus sp.]|uniref:hypothetical protein n=1 Tax=uncultured Anaerococcus sp. TaxID=293428 RepID=UPI0026021212|nr:hypothetical protein [uncultured Anaerococcus sp.]
MGKLFRQIFKEDIKKVMTWMLSPLIIAILGVFVYELTDFRPISLIIVLSGSVMTFAPLISLASLNDSDNNRFYGKKAAFYTSLPFSSSEVTGARLINYIIMGLVIGVFTIFNFLNIGITSDSGLDPIEILKYLSQSINLNIFISMVKFIIIIALFYTIFALIMMAANTLGGSRPFNKMGRSAKLVLFVALILFQGYVYVKLISGLGNTSLIKFKEYSTNAATFSINMLDLNWSSFGIIVLILGAFALAYFALVNYFHKEKISVD